MFGGLLLPGVSVGTWSSMDEDDLLISIVAEFQGWQGWLKSPNWLRDGCKT